MGSSVSKRVCGEPGCARLIPTNGKCAEHARERERERGWKKARGYGSDFKRERKMWAARIAHAPVNCARCGKPITPDMAWHLDHSDDRTELIGPSCARCNLSAAGRASHGLPPLDQTPPF
jgi:hypothetical protein